MTIKFVQILNWQPPGGPWWDKVAETPDEPLIEAQIHLQLSHNEYKELLRRSREASSVPEDDVWTTAQS